MSSGTGFAESGSTYEAGIAVGLQYDLTRGIGVHGEVGGNYAYRRNGGGTAPPITDSSHLVVTRASLGLELYF